MKENPGMKQFEAIEIPDQLTKTVRRGLRKGKQTLFLRQASSALAALMVLIFVTANVPVLYAKAAQIPFLVPVVRMMRVGSGGSQGSGAVGRIAAGKNFLTISFADRDGEKVPVPEFSAAQRKLPRRMILRLHGLAEDRVLELAQALQSQQAVSQAYALSSTDPRQQGVIFHLKPGWSCTLAQSDNALTLSFSWEAPEKPAAQGYVLSSAPMEPGEDLAALTEALLWEGATQLRLSPRDYRVVLGEFTSPEQAEKARESILNSKHISLEVLPISPEEP